MDSALTLDVEEVLPTLDRILHRIARDLLGGRADDAMIDDLVQQGRIGFWKRSASYNPARSAVTTFAHLVAKNAMIDHLRSREAHSCADARLHDGLEIAAPDQDDDESEERQPVQLPVFLLKPSAYFAPGEADVITAIKRYGGDRTKARKALKLTPNAFRSALARARRRVAQLDAA